MIEIVVGTDRPGSRSRQVAELIAPIYRKLGQECQILLLEDVGLSELGPQHYGSEKPARVQGAVERLLKADGLVMIVPEYNGSFPGVLKLFIDQWKYPDSFEGRPVCYIGLGGLFGGLRPVEHLQQIFGYRNAYNYPERIFVQKVMALINPGQAVEPELLQRFEKQAQGFCRYVQALKSENS